MPRVVERADEVREGAGGSPAPRHRAVRCGVLGAPDGAPALGVVGVVDVPGVADDEAVVTEGPVAGSGEAGRASRTRVVATAPVVRVLEVPESGSSVGVTAGSAGVGPGPITRAPNQSSRDGPRLPVLSRPVRSHLWVVRSPPLAKVELTNHYRWVSWRNSQIPVTRHQLIVTDGDRGYPTPPDLRPLNDKDPISCR